MRYNVAMRRLLAAFFFIFFVFFLAQPCHCAPVKILDLGFDNSDKLIYIKSSGDLSSKTVTEGVSTPDVVISKGLVSDPDRIYFDITGAILATPQKSWGFKNSTLESAKISQFSINPNIVRLVLQPKAGQSVKNLEAYGAYMNDSQIIIKYNADVNTKLVENAEFSDVYKDSSGQNPLYENTAAVENVATPQGEDGIIPVKNVAQRQYKLNSKYYISSITPAQKGILIGGTGEVSLKPALYLTEPERMVVDIENAVLAPALRNNGFYFESSSDDGTNAPRKDILRLGQFEKNIVRLVIEGVNAKNYRIVVSPDLQNVFAARRSDIINSKLTNSTSTILSYGAAKSDNADILNINFSAPATFSAFEEGGNFFLDLQNVADPNYAALENLIKNSNFPDVRNIRIALDKTRLIFPIEPLEQVNVEATDDAKSLKISFKSPPKIATTVTNPPKDNEKTDEKPARPSTIKTLYRVVIDPGHGGADSGAIRENVHEKDIVLDISNMVVKNLNKQNIFTDMTHEKDKTVELSERTDFANEISPDLFVSIHANASVKEDIYGIETHWWKENSIELANMVHAQMTAPKRLKAWGTLDRGLFKSQFYVINHTECPAILVEVGFISNPAERGKIVDKKRREEIAQAITDGILDYLKKRKR